MAAISAERRVQLSAPLISMRAGVRERLAGRVRKLTGHYLKNKEDRRAQTAQDATEPTHFAITGVTPRSLGTIGPPASCLLSDDPAFWDHLGVITNVSAILNTDLESVAEVATAAAQTILQLVHGSQK
jgi:hypothetical protein